MAGLGLRDPRADQPRPRGPDGSSVEIDERPDREGARILDVGRIASGAPHARVATPPGVAVDVHEAGAPIVRLLTRIAVQPDAARCEPRERRPKQPESDAASTESLLHEVEPDPSVRLVPPRREDDAHRPPVELG